MTQLLRQPTYIQYDDALDVLKDGPMTCKEVALRLGVAYSTALGKLHVAWRDDKVCRSDDMPYRWRL